MTNKYVNIVKTIHAHQSLKARIRDTIENDASQPLKLRICGTTENTDKKDLDRPYIDNRITPDSQRQSRKRKGAIWGAVSAAVVSAALFMVVFLPLLQGASLPFNSAGTENSESADNEDTKDFYIPFYRKVAREAFDDGRVYTFVNEGYKDENTDDGGVIKYQFFERNIRYRCDDIQGYGSEAEKRDMELINTILDYENKSIEDLLALNPDDYEFEAIDKAMFFRLMRTALTGEPQKEGKDLTYWERQPIGFLSEPQYLSGYKFQIAFLQETGCVDELYIDVLYQTGDGDKDYVQLSDLIDNQTASAEQKQVFGRLLKIVDDIKESENYIVNSAEYKNEKTGEIDFSRLYNFLHDIHVNNYNSYSEPGKVDSDSLAGMFSKK